ncbi:MAG: protease complex subunit PrcB family protein [Clostridium sp.]|nr:protease complex subunit PrcB family protein [Clostridium sp.]
MRKRLRFVSIAVFGFCFLVAVLTGCQMVKSDSGKIKDLDYTVCDESKLPEELNKIIEEKRKEPFKLTYRTKDYLYIVVGYGAQDRTDLQVVMTDLYLTENAIYVNTDLTSKERTTLDGQKVTYPYIAVKCQLYDVQVNFQ